jgi:hypothetical protein
VKQGIVHREQRNISSYPHILHPNISYNPKFVYGKKKSVQYDASKLDSEKELCDMLNIQPCGES